MRPKIWAPGDWNAFFGFGTNILVNLLTLTGLLRFVLKMPDDVVFGRILPATGLMLCLSTVYYAWLAYRLAQKTGRADVCALPSGVSVPHMFVVTFVVMLPIALKTGDPIKGWEAGLTWVFMQSFVLMAGGFMAPIIRRITPRAALLGTLAGVSITFISMKPALEMFLTPVIGITCFAILLLNWFGGVRFRGIPAGLVAIGCGTLVAWLSTAPSTNTVASSISSSSAGRKLMRTAFCRLVDSRSTPQALVTASSAKKAAWSWPFTKSGLDSSGPLPGDERRSAGGERHAYAGAGAKSELASRGS